MSVQNRQDFLSTINDHKREYFRQLVKKQSFCKVHTMRPQLKWKGPPRQRLNHTTQRPGPWRRRHSQKILGQQIQLGDFPKKRTNCKNKSRSNYQMHTYRSKLENEKENSGPTKMTMIWIITSDTSFNMNGIHTTENQISDTWTRRKSMPDSIKKNSTYVV